MSCSRSDVEFAWRALEQLARLADASTADVYNAQFEGLRHDLIDCMAFLDGG